jgi:hypothetical protein
MKIDEQVFANTPINNYAQRFFSLCDAPMWKSSSEFVHRYGTCVCTYILGTKIWP